MSPIAAADAHSSAAVSRFPGKATDPARLAELALLAETDRHVRSHEQAHLAAAGQYARGGPSYQYQTGPDGKQYAIGGEVSIDTSPIPGDPAATAQKARNCLPSRSRCPGGERGQRAKDTRVAKRNGSANS